jgi:GNAT superfamily N-acetyltransferase
MHFRLIEPADLSEIIDVRSSTRENPFSRESLRAHGITEETTAERLRTTHRGWVCEQASKIVGFAIGDGKTGELWVIAVLPEFEGQGVGSQLLALAEGWLWSKGHAEIWLWTSSDPKKRAYSFYSKRDWYVSETNGDISYMRKRRPNHSTEPTPPAGTSAAEHPPRQP